MKIIKLVLLMIVCALCILSREFLALSVLSMFVYIGYDTYKYMYK